MKQSKTVEELDKTAAEAFRTLNLPHYALARFFRLGGAPDIEVVAGKFEPRWAQRYIARNYGGSSQIAREMLRVSHPYSWTDVIARRGLDDTQARIWNEARDFGLRDGLFTPVRWIDGSYAAVVIAGSGSDLLDPVVRAMAEVLSAYYCSETKRLIDIPMKPRLALSSRQRECLAWVRQGKSSTAIGEILGISTQTVDEHVSEACRRLGVRTRVQAAVDACLLGLIDG